MRLLRRIILPIISVLFVAVIAFVSLPVTPVLAVGNRYFVMGQVYVANGTGVITEAGRNVADATMHVTTEGTFTFSMASGTSCVITDVGDGAAITGSPKTLVAGANAVTITGTGTIDFNITIGLAANWNTVNSWSLASGGACGAAVPTSADNVYFNANSFTAASQVVTVDATTNCLDLSFVGATNTPTLACGAQLLNSYGAITLIAAMSITGTSGGLYYNGSSATCSLTTNGLTLGCLVDTRSAFTGTLILQDNLTSTGYLGLTAGVFVTNNKTISVTGVNIAGAGIKTLTLGSSGLTCTSWNYTGSNLTLTANTSTINCSGSFSGGGLTTYNIVNLTGATSTVAGSNTFVNLSFVNPTAAQTVKLTAGTTQTVTDTFTATGFGTADANRLDILTTSAGSSATINAATVAVTKADLKDLIGAGAGSWNFGAASDVRHVSGGSDITYRLYWVGGTGNWSAIIEWATVSGGTTAALIAPDSITNVYFDANSFTGAGQTVTVDATANCLSMDWTGATNTPTLAGASDLSCYDSVTFIPGMTQTYSGILYINGTGTHTFTSAGTLACSIYKNGTGSYTLQDNLTISGTKAIRIYLGTFITGNKNITTYSMYPGFSTGVKTVTLGSSTLTLSAWVYTTSGLTLSANTATINCSADFSGGGITTYNIVNLIGASSTLAGNNTFNTFGLTRAGAQTITATGTTQTATNFVRDAGTSIKTIVNGSFVKVGGGYVSLDYLSISGNTATPTPNQWYAGIHSTDGGGNSGWNFYAPDAPTVSTQNATGIGGITASGNGTLTNLGAGNVTTSTGFEWDTDSGAPYANEVTDAGAYPLGAFTRVIGGLSPGTTFYIRAKASNTVGTGYGGEMSFTTLPVGFPTNFAVTDNGVLTWVLGDYSTHAIIIRGTADYPTSITDGVEIYNGTGLTYTDPNPDWESNIYYYSAWGYNTTYSKYSPTYATVENGGAAMTALASYIFFGVILFVAAVLTVAAYAVKRTALAAFSAVIWMVVCGLSLSQISNNVPIYTALSLVGFIAAIGMSMQAYGFRDKDEEGSDNEDELTFDERLRKQHEEWRQTADGLKLEAELRKDKKQEELANKMEKRYLNGK
jgi:hypothetical protein